MACSGSFRFADCHNLAPLMRVLPVGPRFRITLASLIDVQKQEHRPLNAVLHKKLLDLRASNYGTIVARHCSVLVSGWAQITEKGDQLLDRRACAGPPRAVTSVRMPAHQPRRPLLETGHVVACCLTWGIQSSRLVKE